MTASTRIAGPSSGRRGRGRRTVDVRPTRGPRAGPTLPDGREEAGRHEEPDAEDHDHRTRRHAPLKGERRSPDGARDPEPRAHGRVRAEARPERLRPRRGDDHERPHKEGPDDLHAHRDDGADQGEVEQAHELDPHAGAHREVLGDHREDHRPVDETGEQGHRDSEHDRDDRRKRPDPAHVAEQRLEQVGVRSEQNPDRQREDEEHADDRVDREPCGALDEPGQEGRGQDEREGAKERIEPEEEPHREAGERHVREGVADERHAPYDHERAHVARAQADRRGRHEAEDRRDGHRSPPGSNGRFSSERRPNVRATRRRSANSSATLPSKTTRRSSTSTRSA